MSAESWKLTLPCTRAEAEAIDASGDLGDAIPADAVLMTTEEIEDDVESWRLDAYFEHEPGADTVAAVRALVPSAAGARIAVERLAAGFRRHGAAVELAAGVLFLVLALGLLLSTL